MAELGDDVGLTLRASTGGGDKPHVLASFVDEAARCDTAGYAQRLDWETENFVAHSLRAEGFDEGVCPPLKTTMQPAMAEGWAVRRLTPRECERLQGFPDDFTRIPRYAKRVPKDVLDETVRYIMRGNPEMTEAEAMRWASHPDGPRYKALGNSMAVNVMRWIGQRIQAVENISMEAAE